MEQGRYIEMVEEPAGDGAGWRGRFGFGLAWLAKPRRRTDGEWSAPREETAAEFKGTTFETLLETLTPEQSVTFWYRNTDGRSRRCLQMWVVGEASGASREEALQRTRTLRETLLLLFNAQQGYRFRALLPERIPQSRAAHWTRIRSRSVVISDHLQMARPRVGFNAPVPAGAEGKTRIRIPMLDPDPSRVMPLFTPLASWRPALEVQVTLTGVRVSEAQRKALGRVLELVRQRDPKVFYATDARPMEHDLIEAGLAEWTRWIRYGLSHEHLVRLTAQVGGQAPVPAALAATLGRAMFPHLSFEPLPDGREAAADAVPMDIDLRDMVASDRAVLGALIPKPVQVLGLEGLPWTPAPPPDVLAQEGVRLGDAHGRGVHITDRDRRRHVYVLGATGTGKSTLLLNMILQDIEAGKGVCLIDPHGDLYEQVLRRMPRSRWQERDDVVLFDPTDFDHPVGLNFFECKSPYPDMERSMLINELLQILDILYDLHWTGGPMFEQYFRNALRLLLGSDETYTLVEMPLVFESRAFRDHLLEHCRDRAVVGFWQDQAETVTGETSLNNMAPYVTSKLNQFTHNPLLRNILGQPASTVDLRRCMDEGRILLVNLSKGRLSTMDTYLLGMLLIGMIFRAAMGRVEMAPEERRTWHLYIDEFQNFMTPSVAQMLSEARKFGLALVLANQHLTQLDDTRRGNIMDAVLGNVASMLCFRLGVEDARQLKSFMAPRLGEDDLQFLPDYTVAARLVNRLKPVRPFAFRTAPPPEPMAEDPSPHIRAANLRYTRERQQVEEMIASRRENWDARGGQDRSQWI